MKKKLLILALMIVAIVSVFAISVSAEEYFGDVEIIDLNGDGNSDIAIGDMVSTVIVKDNETGVPATEDARVTLNCTCEAGSHTFPAYYISKKQALNDGFNFTVLNGLIEEYCGNTTGFSTPDITAYEMPNGYTDMNALLFYLPESNKNVFRGTSLKYFSFAKLSTDTEIPGPLTGVNWISTSPVEVVELGNYVTNYPAWFTFNCGKLKKLVVPDQVKSIGNMALYGCGALTSVEIGANSALESIGAQAFKDCDNLTAFYIPNGITSLGANGSNQSPFDGCDKLYFVNDPSETEKPEVYYFPTTVKSLEGEIFKGCASLNDVIVFHKDITVLDNGWAFCNTNAISIVFLGDMTNISTTGNAWKQGIKIYLCNENDLSSADISTLYSSAAFVYCNADGNETHLYKVDKEATCTEEGGKGYSCFCGEKNPEVTPIPALGHTKGDFIELKYDNGFLKVGYYYYKCAACDVERYTYTDKAEYQVPAIFVNNGYAYSGTAILQGFAVNLEALGAYEATGKTVQYGLAVASVAKLGATNTLFDGTTLKSGAFSASFDDKKQYSIFEMQVTGLVDDYKDAELFVCAYVIDGDTVTYISNGANTTTVEAVTYNQVVASAAQNQTTDIIVKKEENV